MIAKATTWQTEMHAQETVEKVHVVSALILTASKTLNLEATKSFMDFSVQLGKTQREGGAAIAHKAAGARGKKDKGRTGPSQRSGPCS